MKHTYAVIMAGGKGQRIWPASRIKSPKQLLALWGRKSMLERTSERLSPLIGIDETLVVTGSRYEGLVKKQLPHLKKDGLVLEPCGKNTAACIGLSALWLRRRSPDAVMVVLPSDHVIRNKDNFHKVLSAALALAKDDAPLVTLGIAPRFPATGFGYIKLGDKHKCAKGVDIFKAEKFVEKPDVETAKRYIQSGRYVWNAGIFIWKAESILRSMERHIPKLYSGLLKIDGAIGTRRYRQVIEREYAKFEDISVDNGILERSRDIHVVFSELKWDDVGSWSSLDCLGFHDKDENIAIGENFEIDTKGSILVSDAGHLLATIGLRGMIVVQSKDATLVCTKERAQEVKELVKRLRASSKFRKYT